jgi:hypothetical protein
MATRGATHTGRQPPRLSIGDLRRVTTEHVHRAVRRIRDGAAIEPFAPSTDFDLLMPDGARLPPKAVFGNAASEALGFAILPRHFTGGLGTPAFAVLEQAGYCVVRKPPVDADPGPTLPVGDEHVEDVAEFRQLTPLRNPPWTRDETVLLLDLYLRRPNVSPTDPEVQALSRLLNLSPTAPKPRLPIPTMPPVYSAMIAPIIPR